MYFLKTVKKGSKTRLVALGNQDLHGEPVNTSMNVSATYSVREAYPVGTVFATMSLSNMGTHYSSGPIFPMDVVTLAEPGHAPTSEMVKAFQDFKKKFGIDTSHVEEPAEEPVFAAELSLFDLSETTEKLDAKRIREIEASMKAKRAGKTAPKPAAKPAAKPALPFIAQLLKDHPMPSIEDCGFYINPTDYKQLLRNIARKVNTILTGPTGTGKTELIRLLGKVFDKPVHIFDMGSMFDPTVQMLGSHRLEAGSSVFDFAPFAKAVQEPCIILLDELSRAPITTNNLLFPCLDARRELHVEQAGSKETTVIPVHPECVFVATANLGSQYVGTSTLDEALRDRFHFMELDYMPAPQEAEVLVKRQDISPKDANNIVRIANTVRSLFRKGELSSSISTRETLQVASFVADGFSTTEALELVVLPRFEGTNTEGERSVVRKIFMAA